MLRRSVFLILSFLCTITTMESQDNYREARERMVKNQIERRGIKDKILLDVMRTVPRHKFVPEQYQSEAYNDNALPIGWGQTISQPYVVAFTLSVLKLKKNHRALEVGAGSGYLAALLGELVDHVTAIEIVEELGQIARERLKNMGYRNVDLIIGDGYEGYAPNAPFDVIIVSARTDDVPPGLFEQLNEGGRLIIPLGPDHGVQYLTLYIKKDGKLKKKVLDAVRFVPLTRNKK